MVDFSEEYEYVSTVVREREHVSRVSAVVIVLVFFCILPGCFVGEFISSYFNTYYNAQRLFGEAEDEIWNLPETKQSGRDYLVPFTASVATKAKFTSVIEKCSKLLQYHPESGLVDDALLMIGKSYFYQGEDQKAERKFKELILGYPQSSLLVDAELMMAYTYFRMPNRDSALVYAKNVVDLAGKRGDDSYVARASNVLGQIEFENKNYAPARGYFERAAELGDNPEMRAAAYINVAQMYNLLGDYANAEAAYRRARQSSNNYQGEYRGQIGVMRMLVKQGKYDQALAGLSALRSNGNNKEFFGEIDLETANALRDQGEIRAALAQYAYVDTSYARTETSANSYYQLGLLYEKRIGLYDSARVAYNKGKSENPTAKVTPLLIRRSDLMNKYWQYRSELTKNDSIRTALITQRDSVVPMSAVAPVDTLKKDSTKIAQTIGADTARPKPPAPPPIPIDTINVRLAFYTNELGGLFYTGLELPDSARLYYDALMRLYPNSPLVPRALFTQAQIFRQDSTIAPTVVDSMYMELIKRFPQSDFAAEAQRLLGLPVTKKETDAALESYRIGENLMLAGNGPAAIDTFETIPRRFPSSPLAAKALYAAGWLYDQTADQRDSAIAVFERLAAKYPYTQYAMSVAPKLAEVAMKRRADAQSAAKDTTAKAVTPTVAPPPQTSPVLQDEEIKRRPASFPKPVRPGGDTTARTGDPGVTPPLKTPSLEPDNEIKRQSAPLPKPGQPAVDTTTRTGTPAVAPPLRTPPAEPDSEIKRQPTPFPRPVQPAADTTAPSERPKQE